MARKVLSNLMEKEVTRKQFLSMLGLGIVGLTGISSVLDMMTRQESNAAGQGYGYGAYGGDPSKVQAAKIEDNPVAH